MGLALLFSLAAFGISETTYLIKQRRAQRQTFCLLGKTCSVVLESKYNKILGIHNDLWGLIFYSTISLLTALLVIGTNYQTGLEKITETIIYLGALASLYFTYLQWRVIKAWCLWCLMSALTTFLLALISMTLY